MPSGSGRIATLDFTMENQSPVAAITIGTMVTVSELLFPANSAAVSDAKAQQNANAYASGVFSAPDPDIRTIGHEPPVLLTAVQPVNSDSILPPGDTVSRQFDVVIPPVRPHMAVALEVTWHVLYARSSRLTLGTFYRPRFYFSSRNNSCHQFEELSWAINQSALVRFTRGAQVLSTWWCADLSGPFIGWGVQAPGRLYETQRVRDEIMTDIGVQHSNRSEVFLLAGA